MEGNATLNKTLGRENELWLLLRQASNLIYKAIGERYICADYRRVDRKSHRGGSNPC